MVYFRQGPGWRCGWFVRVVSKGRKKGKCEVLIGYKRKRMFLRVSEIRFQDNYKGEIPKGGRMFIDDKARAFLENKEKKKMRRKGV